MGPQHIPTRATDFQSRHCTQLEAGHADNAIRTSWQQLGRAFRFTANWPGERDMNVQPILTMTLEHHENWGRVDGLVQLVHHLQSVGVQRLDVLRGVSCNPYKKPTSASWDTQYHVAAYQVLLFHASYDYHLRLIHTKMH